MTLLFLSNYFNHHQKPFSDVMFLSDTDGNLSNSVSSKCFDETYSAAAFCD